MKRAKGKNDVVPPDEGDELYDCDGDEISYPINIDNQLEESDDENEQITENATSNENFFLKLYGPFLWMGFNCLKA